jgi:hypothetical protein
MVQTAAQKLGVKPGMRVRVEGVAPETVRNHVNTGSEPATPTTDGPAEIILFYAHSVEDVTGRASALFADVAPNGRFWVAYRKGATKKAPAGTPGEEPLHRDSLQRALMAQNLEGVTLIALDDIWSAMRVKRAVSREP